MDNTNPVKNRLATTAHRLVAGKATSTFTQLFRYGWVALVGLVFDIGVLILLKEVYHLNVILAATLSFSGAIVVNFVLSSWWIFEHKRHYAVEFAFFFGIGLVGLALNDGILWLLTSKLGIYYLEGKAIATFIVFFWNFLGRKAILFV